MKLNMWINNLRYKTKTEFIDYDSGDKIERNRYEKNYITIEKTKHSYVIDKICTTTHKFYGRRKPKQLTMFG
jgi:hypothetical protein